MALGGCVDVCECAILATAKKVAEARGVAVTKMVTIERPEYVQTLMDSRMNGFVKVITGVRRCGKSFLLDKLFRRRLEEEGVSPEQIISVDLDNSKMKRRAGSLVAGRVSA